MRRSGFNNSRHARESLSADQITNILQKNPDLVLELKSQLADRLQQQQGVLIDPSEISDQTLYNQIATNADLRANITTVLRARGYVSDDDLQSAASSACAGRQEQPAIDTFARVTIAGRQHIPDSVPALGSQLNSRLFGGDRRIDAFQFGRG